MSFLNKIRDKGRTRSCLEVSEERVVDGSRGEK
jgi:hypothetical protein